MTIRTTFQAILLSVLALCNSCALDRHREIVTDVSANTLLRTVAERYGMSVSVLARGRILHLDKDAQPGGVIAITSGGDIGGPDQVRLSLTEADIERWGRRYSLVKGEQNVGEIQLGIFPSHDRARDVFNDHLRHTSVGPDKNLTKEFGTKAVGWSHRGEGDDPTQILLVRDDVVVSVYLVFPRLMASAGSGETTMLLAREIDAALAEGTCGVRREISR